MLTIVIGDHHRLFREAIAEWLSRQEDVAAVHEAGNSDQVIDLACREHPDLIIMDSELPGRDPFDAVFEVHKVKPNCKVLFVAERPYDAYVEAALACGANGFLPKHEPLSVLKEAMTKIMDTGLFLSKPLLERLTIKNGQLLLGKPRGGLFARLTEREWDLLRLLASGETLKQAAATMHVTYKAADNLKTNITRKLDIHDRVALARFAMREGVVCPAGPDERVQRRIDHSLLPEALQPLLRENGAFRETQASVG